MTATLAHVFKLASRRRWVDTHEVGRESRTCARSAVGVVMRMEALGQDVPSSQGHQMLKGWHLGSKGWLLSLTRPVPYQTKIGCIADGSHPLQPAPLA